MNAEGMANDDDSDPFEDEEEAEMNECFVDDDMEDEPGFDSDNSDS